MIAGKFNMEDVFFRDLTVCVLDTLEGQIKWVNRFSSGDIYVQVPFYYSLSGDERFLLDTFQDDIVSENRFVELNTDIIPRGHITLKSFNIMSDEFANPNVWLRMVVENQVEIRKILAKVRAVPITVDYELSILLSNEIDTFKCSQAILDTLWIYKFMYFEHNFMNIDAVIIMPDSSSIEINREKNLTSDNTIKLTLSFQVQTYYPAFRRDRVNLDGYPTLYGTGQSDGADLNNWNTGSDLGNAFDVGGDGTAPNPTVTGDPNGPDFIPLNPDSLPPGGPPGRPFPGSLPWPYNETPFDIPGELPQYGQTGSFGGWPAGSAPTPKSDSDYFSYAPKRTRWFNNILKARQNANAINSNPNAGKGANGNDTQNPPINPNPI
jgi:hypothetical protein